MRREKLDSMEDSPKDRLRNARIAAGFETATDAARSFRWTVSTYLGHENGDRGMSKKSARKYAAAFKIDPLGLLYEKTPKPGGPYRDQIDLERLAHMLGWVLNTYGKMLENEADNLAKAIVEYACKPLDQNEPSDRDAARQDARVLTRLSVQQGPPSPSSKR
jgi:hypothetical protein